MNTRRSTYSVLTAAALVAVLTGCSTGDDQPEPVTPENTSTEPRERSMPEVMMM